MKKVKIFLLACVTAFLFTGCGEKEVKLSDYIDVRYSGINGRASASVDIHFSDLESIVLGENPQEINQVFQMAQLEDSIKYELSRDTNLSNGDTIKMLLQWDEDMAKECGVKFSESEILFTVSGLEDGKEIDLFADIEIDYSGVSPEATASVRNTSQDAFISMIQYSVMPSDKLAIGDEICVTAKCDVDRAEEKGYIVSETERTFIVEGIDEYISEYASIDEELRTAMDEQARDKIDARLADRWKYGKTMYPDLIYAGEIEVQEIVDINLCKVYFLSLKDGLTGDSFTFTDRNIVYFVYEVTVIDSKTEDGKTTYIPVYFKDLIMRDNGKLDVVLTDAQFTYSTYNSFDDFYRECVTAKKDRYNIEEGTF